MNGSETNLSSSSSTWPQRIAAALSGTLQHRHEDEHGNLQQYYNNPNENNNYLVSLLHDEMDTNGDGTVSLHELWSWTQRTLATGHDDEHENELLSTTYSLSTWLTKTLQVLWSSCTSWSRSNVLLWLAALWVVSIIPGRLHGWSGKVLKWPILVLTYAMITLELLVYIGIRLAIRVAEATVATPKHRQLRRTMAQAQSYAEWYRLATALDRSQNRHVWLQQPHPHEPTEQPEREPPKHHNTHKHHRSNKNTTANSLAGTSSETNDNDTTTTTRTTTDSSSSSSSHNYNWRLVQELQKELQEARHHHASLSSTHQLHTTLAVLQQCTRGPNVGGIMSSDLFSYSNTGQPKQAVLLLLLFYCDLTKNLPSHT